MKIDHAELPPDGENGKWKIQTFVVEGDEKSRKLLDLMSFSNGNGARFIPNGVYKRLYRGKTLVMSSTPAEMKDMKDLAYEARHSAGGAALINGLGLGCTIEFIAPYMERIRIIEIDQELIDLVGPHWGAKYPGKVEIVCANALEYNPPKGERYSIVWHDIWDDVSADNLPDMHRLHRKYGRRCDWQGSWMRWWCEKDARS